MVKALVTRIFALLSKTFVVLLILVSCGMLGIASIVYKLSLPTGGGQYDAPIPSKITEDRFLPDGADLKLALSLLRFGLRENDGNFVISPFVFYKNALLLAHGANGESLNELRRGVLKSDADKHLINKQLIDYQKGIAKDFKIRNSVWGDNLTPEYKEAVGQLADIQSRPWLKQKFGQWVQKGYKSWNDVSAFSGKITDRQAVYLLNTINFKYQWYNMFDGDNTEIEPFYSWNNADGYVYMMHSASDVDYYEDERMQSVRLYFLDTAGQRSRYDQPVPHTPRNHIDIRFFLPKEHIDFEEFVSELQIDDLNITYQKKQVELYIPRIQLGQKQQDMIPLFKDLGIRNIFVPQNQNLAEMSRKPKYIGSVLQIGNSIILDETGIGTGDVCAYFECGCDILDEDLPLKFRANRPFVFMLGQGLFIGVYREGHICEAENLDSHTVSPATSDDIMFPHEKDNYFPLVDI